MAAKHKVPVAFDVHAQGLEAVLGMALSSGGATFKRKTFESERTCYTNEANVPAHAFSTTEGNALEFCWSA